MKKLSVILVYTADLYYDEEEYRARRSKDARDFPV